jgi:glycosyltransferase involved in cell wall biosynthesis
MDKLPNLPEAKKIIIIGPAYPYRGGPSTVVSYLYKILHEKFEVKIYNYKLLYPSLFFPGTTQYDKSTKLKLIVPSERLINSVSPINWINVANKINKEKADLVIFDWWQPFFAPCHFIISQIIKKKFRGRILFLTENFISHEARWIDKLLTKLGLSNADMFLALSDTVAEELKTISSGRRIYKSELPPFDFFADETVIDIKEKRAELGLRPEDRVLLFFGYIRKYKGLDILIKAIPSIVKEIPETRLLIVGEFYDGPDYYFKLIKSLCLEKIITVVNRFVPNEEVADYYSICDVVVLPYRSATQSAVLNVSYSFHKPVIATNVGGLSEFVEEGKTGILIEPGSTESLAQGMKKFFDLKSKVDFEKNIREKIRDNKFLQLPDLLEEILQKSTDANQKEFLSD